MSGLEITKHNEGEWRELVSTYHEDCGGIVAEIRSALSNRDQKTRHLAQLSDQLGRINPSSEKWKRVADEVQRLELELGL